MFYKQIILQQELPFEVKLPSEKITDISQLSEKELNEKLEKAYEDMLKGRTRNAKDVLSDIRKNNKLYFFSTHLLTLLKMMLLYN